MQPSLRAGSVSYAVTAFSMFREQQINIENIERIISIVLLRGEQGRFLYCRTSTHHGYKMDSLLAIALNLIPHALTCSRVLLFFRVRNHYIEAFNGTDARK